MEAYRVVVHGTAQRSVAPDVATLGLRILEVDEDQRAAFAHCQSRVVVECRPDVAAQAISEAIAAGVDRLSGPRFSVRDRGPVIEELLGEAIGAARRKAERVAEAASRSLGGVVAVEEAPYGRWDDDGSFEEEEIVELTKASSAGVDLQPAQVTLSASVRVTFSLAGNTH